MGPIAMNKLRLSLCTKLTLTMNELRIILYTKVMLYSVYQLVTAYNL